MSRWTIRVVEGAAVLAGAFALYELGKYIAKKAAESAPAAIEDAAKAIEPVPSWHPNISDSALVKSLPAKVEVPKPVYPATETAEPAKATWLLNMASARDTSPQRPGEDIEDYMRRIYAPSSVVFTPYTEAEQRAWNAEHVR